MEISLGMAKESAAYYQLAAAILTESGEKAQSANGRDKTLFGRFEARGYCWDECIGMEMEEWSKMIKRHERNHH